MSLERKLLLVLCLACWSGNTWAQETPRLKEVDVLKLIELQPDDSVILKRLRASQLDFNVDSATLARLRGAGASEAVLAALRDSANQRNGLAAATETITYERFETRDKNKGAIELRGFKIDGYLREDSVEVLKPDGTRAIAGGGSVGDSEIRDVGKYKIVYSGSDRHGLSVEVQEGRKTVVHFGAVALSAAEIKFSTPYWIHSIDGEQLTGNGVTQSWAIYLLPGVYDIRVADTKQRVQVDPGKLVKVQLGTFTVTGRSWVFRHAGAKDWSIQRGEGVQVNLLPGKYEWSVGSPDTVDGVVEIKAGANVSARAPKEQE